MSETDAELVELETDDRPAGELWIRTAQLVDVSFADRTIELIVIPYDTPTLVGYNGRMVHETVRRGSFDGIERRANRVRVNREHERMQTVGRAVAFHPSRDEGLVSEVKIARTPLGDETLELAADGCLDASAGFLPMAGGMRWLERSAYEVTKAWLGHIAMTSEPAYEGARVLSVRSADGDPPLSATPNLDQWRAMVADDRLAALVRSGQALS
jgi:HK97 family phage prohead protease